MTVDADADADAAPVRPPRFDLRLFVAGSTTRSLRAIANLRQLCDTHLTGRADLLVIDIYQQPQLAAQYQVVAVPTLLRLLPLPARRLVGDMSQTDRVLRGLDLSPWPPHGP